MSASCGTHTLPLWSKYSWSMVKCFHRFNSSLERCESCVDIASFSLGFGEGSLLVTIFHTSCWAISHPPLLMRERRCGKRFDFSSSPIIPFAGGHTREEEYLGDSWLWLRTCVVFHPHTHTRNAGSPRNNSKRTRCVTHLLIVINVVAIQGRRVGNCKFPWAPPLCRFVVGKLPHSHRLCSKCVVGEEEVRKKLRRSLHRTPSSSSSPSSLFSHTAYATSA